MSANEPSALAPGDLIFARVSKVGMYYAASVHEANPDGSLSVVYRDLKKTATVPRSWILPRGKTDGRSVIVPQEIITSPRATSEAHSSSSSPMGGERLRANASVPSARSPTHSSAVTSSSPLDQAAPNGQPCSTHDSALPASPDSGLPSFTGEERPTSLTGGGRRPSLTPVLPPTPPPPLDVPPLAMEALRAPVLSVTDIEAARISPEPTRGAEGMSGDELVTSAAKEALPITSVPTCPTTPTPRPTPTPAPVNQRNKSDVEGWYKAEFGDLLAYTRGVEGDETSEEAAGSCFASTGSSSRRPTATSASVDALLASTLALIDQPPLEAELLSAEFGICSSYVVEMKEMLESLEASLSSTHQLYETSQRDWNVNTLELKQQLEARAAVVRPPSPSPLTLDPTSTDQMAMEEGATTKSVEGDFGQPHGEHVLEQPDLQRVIEEQEQVIQEQQGTLDELTRERDQLKWELAVLRREDEGFNRSALLAKEPDTAFAARDLEAKLKTAEQMRSHKQQSYLQEQHSLRLTLDRTMFLPTDEKGDDKNFLEPCLEPHQRLIEHTGTVRALALDPLSGEVLFSASDDMSIRVWTLHPPAQQWKCTQVLTAHEAQVQVLCLDADGNVLFTGDALGTILIWTRNDGGKGPWVRKGAMRVSSQPSITSLVWSSNVLAADQISASFLSNALTGYRTIARSSGVLYSGSMDGVLRSWRYSEKRCGAKTKLPGGPITCMHEYSQYLAVGHASGDLALVTQEDLQLLKVAHEAHSRKITAMVVVEHRMFTASHDASIKVWLLPNLECQTTLIGHYSRIECLALSGNGSRLYSGSADMSVMSWDVQGRCVEQGFVEHTDSVSALLTATSSSVAPVASAAGGAEGEEAASWLFSGSADCTIQVWKASDKGFLPQPSPAQQSPRGVRDNVASDQSNVPSGSLSAAFGSFGPVRVLEASER